MGVSKMTKNDRIRQIKYYELVQDKIREATQKYSGEAQYSMLHRWRIAYSNGKIVPVFINNFVLAHPWWVKQGMPDMQAILDHAPSSYRIYNDSAKLSAILHKAFIYDEKGKLVKALPEIYIKK